MRYTCSAQDDLRAIRDYGDDVWGEARSDEFLESLITAIEHLDGHPMRGRSRDTFLAGLRSILFRGYIVFYVAEGADLKVIGVLHERRNHAALDFADRMAD